MSERRGEAYKRIGDALSSAEAAVHCLVHDAAGYVLKIRYLATMPAKQEYSAKHIEEVAVELTNSMFGQAEFAKYCLGDMYEKSKSALNDVGGCFDEAMDDLKRTRELVDELRLKVLALEEKLSDRRREDRPSDPAVRAQVLAMTDGKCAYCEAEISDQSGDGKADFVVEHIVPKSCGGPDHLKNFAPACSRCNSEKSANHVLPFIRRRAS